MKLDLPAFPQTTEYGGRETGITKREYFIAAALQGLMANPNTRTLEDVKHNIHLVINTVVESYNVV